jgi:hypothetical protein
MSVYVVIQNISIEKIKVVLLHGRLGLNHVTVLNLRKKYKPMTTKEQLLIHEAIKELGTGIRFSDADLVKSHIGIALEALSKALTADVITKRIKEVK